MSKVLVAGSDLSQFGQYTNGTGTITTNADGSVTCTSSDTNSRAYLYWKCPAKFGETIIVKIKGKALSTTKRDDTAPKFNVLWMRKNGTTQVAGFNGYFSNSNDFTEETLLLNVNEPVQEGDYIQVGFGCFASSLTNVTIKQASIQVVNSEFPIKRTALQALIKIPASDVDVAPVPVINDNFNKIGDMVFSFDTGMLKIISPALINLAKAYAGGKFSIDPVQDSAGAYRKYYPTIGLQDRTNGSVYISFTDRSTNEAVDLSKIANTDLFYQFAYEVL